MGGLPVSARPAARRTRNASGSGALASLRLAGSDRAAPLESIEPRVSDRADAEPSDEAEDSVADAGV